MPDRNADRMEKLISRLQRGQRLRVDEADASGKDAIITAAQLAAAREPHAATRPEFKQHLASLVGGRGAAGLTRRPALAGALAAAAGLAAGVGRDRLIEVSNSLPPTAGQSGPPA